MYHHDPYALGHISNETYEEAAVSVLAPIEIGQGPQNWAAQGACATADPDELFVRGKAQHDAKLVCRSCPVSLQCLADALDNRVEFGVWGGLTERRDLVAGGPFEAAIAGGAHGLTLRTWAHNPAGNPAGPAGISPPDPPRLLAAHPGRGCRGRRPAPG